MSPSPGETEIFVFSILNRIARICREINAFGFLKFLLGKRGATRSKFAQRNRPRREICMRNAFAAPHTRGL
jgi:hypothetical protein